MLSRRSVRIKIMQLLYALDRDSDLTPKELYKKYNTSVDDSFNLFVYVVYLFLKITEQSKEDENKRRSKHLPSEFDKAFTAKLFFNKIIQSFRNDDDLQGKFSSLGFTNDALGDFLSQMYKGFAKTEEYEKYILNGETNEDHLDILLELFRYLRVNEFFNDTCEEKYIQWADEKSLIVGVMKKYLKAQPDEPGSFKQFRPDDETVKEYGNTLLKSILENQESLEQAIVPFLKNWDSDRLAVLDMILLKMAITEMKEFESIPPTVTINEYVEIAKAYSTDKSREFINGVLDAYMKAM